MMHTSDTPRSLAVILNPTAGNQRAGRARAGLLQALEASGTHFEIIPTERPRHATQIAEEVAGEYDAVVAAGGDGTLQEILTGVYRANNGGVLGVVPLGTGNDFGDLIGMPHRPELAIPALLAAKPVPVDAGHVRWREAEGGPWYEAIFINAVGIGFDAMVAIEAARFKRLRGKATYLAGIISALAKWPYPHVRLERIGPSDVILPGGKTTPANGAGVLHEGQLFLAAAGNGRTVGGGFTLTPHARANDGLLDLCFVEHVRKRRLPFLIPRVIKGSHLGQPEIVSERLEGLRITSTEVGLPLHFDGEVLTQSAVEIEVHVLPNAVKMLCPDASIDPVALVGDA